MAEGKRSPNSGRVPTAEYLKEEKESGELKKFLSKDIVKEVAQVTKLPREIVREIYSEACMTIYYALARGYQVRITYIGTLQLLHMPYRNYHFANDATKEKYKERGWSKIVFKPARDALRSLRDIEGTPNMTDVLKRSQRRESFNWDKQRERAQDDVGYFKKKAETLEVRVEELEKENLMLQRQIWDYESKYGKLNLGEEKYSK